MNNNTKYGALLTPDAKIHRRYFKEMCDLIGIKVIYRAPRPDKHYTTYAEINSNYYEPILESCIFDDHPSQRTMRKLGWDSELQTDASIISVRYDLPNIQKGALFIIPSGLDCAQGRVFRLEEISNIMIYPASLTCKLVPEYENTFTNTSYTHENDSFNLLNEEESNLWSFF